MNFCYYSGFWKDFHLVAMNETKSFLKSSLIDDRRLIFTPCQLNMSVNGVGFMQRSLLQNIISYTKMQNIFFKLTNEMAFAHICNIF